MATNEAMFPLKINYYKKKLQDNYKIKMKTVVLKSIKNHRGVSCIKIKSWPVYFAYY